MLMSFRFRAAAVAAGPRSFTHTPPPGAPMTAALRPSNSPRCHLRLPLLPARSSAGDQQMALTARHGIGRLRSRAVV